MPHIDHPRIARFPGVWLLALCNTLLAIRGISAVSPGLHEPLPEGWAPSAAITAPYFVGLYVGIIVAAVGACLGIRILRTLLIVLLAVLIAFYLREDWNAAELFLFDTGAPATSAVFKASLVFAPILRVFYLALNGWYFFGSRTRSFYAPRTSSE
jgi:hypothetical protein